MTAPLLSRPVPHAWPWSVVPARRRPSPRVALIAVSILTAVVCLVELRLGTGAWALVPLLALNVSTILMVQCIERRRRAELGEQLAHAELRALRAQLHPHFLFNALQTVDGLLREQRSADASRAIVQLGGLLRRCLRSDAETSIPLREELAIVRDYVALERLRYGDRLEVRESIDPSVLEAPLPAMTLQLLVENAIRHGALPGRGHDRITVSARTCNGSLELCVENGIDPRGGSSAGFGIGLAAVRRRLDELAPHRCAVDVARDDHGFSVRIRIACNPVPLAEESAA